MNYPEYAKIGDKLYKINTDFRNAIECNRIAEDGEINDIERALAIIYVLFGDEGLNAINDYEELLKKAKLYLSCGEVNKKNTKEEPDMDFVEDFSYIKTSFRSDYGINLDKEKMHWWEFYDLVNGLSNSEFGNCCVLNRIRNLRNYDTKDIKDEKTRRKIIEAKKQVALKKNRKKATKEQQESANKLLKDLGLI